jgi:hypothetical protein
MLCTIRTIRNRNSKMPQDFNMLLENLEKGDLKRLVHPELHIDEYKSKMGDDADICVISFKVAGKEPSIDLVSFIEKGYDFVLDADVSSGEKEGGDYLVFIEIERTPELPDQIIRMMSDVMRLTEQEFADWRVRYHKSAQDHELSADSLRSQIVLTPEKYRARYDKEKNDLDNLKAAAGVKIDTRAPVNNFTESIRIAAGIK